uniref:Uncharacterized protein n=1 Tax=Setaria viridis TaxID=4556 RepID=A0A4U6WBU8_SETVI|nr:hypothetical protein SEVIR_2G358633v2 [Setaria viridis]
MRRGPRALCYRGGDCKATCERSGFSGFTLSGGVWCCGTIAEGPASRWPSRCGAISFYRFPIKASSCLEVSANYEHGCWWVLPWRSEC